MSIAGRASLKTMLSRWENGGRVSPLYADLLCKVYDATPDELGFEPSAGDAALPVPRVPPRVSAGTIAYFGNVFAQHLLADNLMGPHHLVDAVRTQAAMLDQVIREAHGTIRQKLVVLACRYNEFAGWLYQDAGEPANATTYTDRAMDYALGLDDAREMAYVLMRKSNIASDLGQAGRGLGLANAALRDQTWLPAQVRALILAQRGRALALVGDADGAARTLDQAFRAVERWDGEPDTLASYCNLPYVAMEAAACWDHLGKPDTAVSIFERNAKDWPPSQQRDYGLFLARLASSYAAQSDKDRACATGWDALDAVSRATSARAMRELQRLRSRLSEWRRDTEVAELSSAIRQLLRPA
ncbi:MAG: hypothetical protein ACRDT4_07430 [Micromonosporaceae bacterium]